MEVSIYPTDTISIDTAPNELVPLCLPSDPGYAHSLL